MGPLSYWRWNTQTDDFEAGASLWEKLYEEYPDHFSSPKNAQQFFYESEIDHIKKTIKNALVRSDSSLITATTTHKTPDNSNSFSLVWKGEPLSGPRSSSDSTTVSGEVLNKMEPFSSVGLQIPQHPEFYQQLMDNLPDSVFFKDLESRFIAINKACAKKFGLTDPDKAKGKTDFDFFNLSHAQQAFEDEQKIIKTGEPMIHKAEKEVYQNDDKLPTWTSTSKMPLYDRHGTIVGTFGISTDITDQRLALKENKRLKSQLESIFDSTPNMIFVKDWNGQYLIVNQSKAKYHRLNKKDIIGKKDVDLGVSKELADSFLEKDRQVIRTEEPLFMPEDISYTPEGDPMWYQTIKVPFQLVESEELASLSIVTDVTARKKRELELNETIDLIGEQNKLLKNFAHIVSHNLRNHAGSISLLLEMYQLEDCEEEKAEFINQLEVASNRLKETIIDLNEIIDQQYQSLKVEKEVNLLEFVKKGMQILSTDINAYNVTIEIDIPEDLKFNYNPSYLESILLNLLSNAIKYRSPDRDALVEIEGYRKNEQIHLHVKDNGIGINLEKHKDDIFGMYQTFHSNKDAKGIGLFITKNQIESMGGEISVESTPGKGTSFHARLN